MHPLLGDGEIEDDRKNLHLSSRFSSVNDEVWLLGSFPFPFPENARDWPQNLGVRPLRSPLTTGGLAPNWFVLGLNFRSHRSVDRMIPTGAC